MKKKNCVMCIVIIALILIGIIFTYYYKPFTYLNSDSISMPEGGLLMSNQEAVNGYVSQTVANSAWYDMLNGKFQFAMLWLILIGICALIYQNAKKK